MHTPRVSLVASPSATVPLRFDDPDFLRAIEQDADGDGRGRLASVLEVSAASDVDFEPYIDDGFVLNARKAVETGDRLDQFSVAQSRDGAGVDIKKSAARRWADWVLSVEVGDWVELPADFKAVLLALSSRNRAVREAAYLKLPAHVGAAFLGRLDAYRWTLNRAADRDPDKTAARPAALGEARAPSLATGPSFNGDLSLSDGAGQ